ncbi:hypothetical protein BDR04DRAFT_1120444 [Suillus decipiens]|nr:hypothetical protein BDR04DRAFT_1120444 [Suillus decipiens]
MVNEACKLIYKNNYAVSSTPVKCILKEQSWVPTSDKSLVHTLDQRYRETPTFVQATIWKFVVNSSEMKRMATCNFENLLWCSIPIFNGLLPEPYNMIVLKLLFNMAHWHGLAKLRMHSDLTLDIMDQVTTMLGSQFCTFNVQVCSVYDTHKLQQEVEACKQHFAKQAAKYYALQKGKQTAHAVLQGTRCEEDHTATNLYHTKLFNFQMYKFHAVGDYVSTIRQYGTCDSYSTEPGELEHHLLKARLAFVTSATELLCVLISNWKSYIATSPGVHHHIGLLQKSPIHIGTFLHSHQGDLAIKQEMKWTAIGSL